MNKPITPCCSHALQVGMPAQETRVAMRLLSALGTNGPIVHTCFVPPHDGIASAPLCRAAMQHHSTLVRQTWPPIRPQQRTMSRCTARTAHGIAVYAARADPVHHASAAMSHTGTATAHALRSMYRYGAASYRFDRAMYMLHTAGYGPSPA